VVRAGFVDRSSGLLQRRGASAHEQRSVVRGILSGDRGARSRDGGAAEERPVGRLKRGGESATGCQIFHIEPVRLDGFRRWRRDGTVQVRRKITSLPGSALSARRSALALYHDALRKPRRNRSMPARPNKHISQSLPQNCYSGGDTAHAGGGNEKTNTFDRVGSRFCCAFGPGPKRSGNSR
jgi:hypothetical protein